MKNIIIFVFLVFSSLTAHAQDPILIYGNQIYDDETILKIAGIDYEKPPTLSEMKQKLETTGYFSSVRVKNDGRGIVIVVREKTPWFVLPYFTSDAETKIYGIAAGLVGMDGNHSKILARAQTGTNNKAASFMYRDDFFLDSFFIVGYTMDFENAKHDIYQNRKIIQRTRNKALNNTFHFGYHFLPSLLMQFDTHVEFHDFEEPSQRNSKGTQVSHRIFAEYGNYYLNEGLAKGYWIKPYVEITNPLSDYKFYQIGVFAQASMFRRGDFNWIAKPRAEFGKPQPHYQKFEVGGSKLRSFPSQVFRSDTYGAIQNDILITSWDIWKLKLRPIAYVDWAYIDRGGRTGLGAGLQVYFKNVAVPAIQIQGGYGFRPNGFSVIASIGPQI